VVRSPFVHELVVRGRLPQTIVDEVVVRFGDVSFDRRVDRTVIGLVADQAALRALLSLMWDVGVEILTLTSVPPTD
jgi:hypothetical protein